MKKCAVHTRCPSERREARSGFLYVAVLLTTTLVAIIGLAAASVAHLEMRIVSQSADLLEAQTLARSAVEEALLRIDRDPDWRTTYAHGVEAPQPGEAVGTGTIAFKLLDSDGNLADDESDSVEVIGIGRVGNIVAAESVRLYPTGRALTCLGASFCCDGDITLEDGASIKTSQRVVSNGTINASGSSSSIVGNAEAAGSVLGTVTGEITVGATPRQMPSGDAFEYYRDNGTWINVNSISSGTIENVVLGPSSNPFGTQTNAEGIYVIDCGGQNVVIRNCRILGTLVLLNPGSNSYVGNSVRWDALVPNYPALLVDGSLDILHGKSNLSESGHGGSEDSDTSDTYPSGIRGLVFINGQFGNAQSGGNPIDGVLIAQTSRIQSDCELTCRSTFADYPPPGFTSGNPMRVSPGSWKRAILSP
jgi:hypothetical protein